MDGERRFCQLEVDPDAATVVLYAYEDGERRLEHSLSYAWDEDGTRRLTLSGEHLKVVLRWSDPEGEPLRSRGFHWVSEAPYNR